MPIYRFVAAEGEKSCDRCREGFEAVLPVGEILRFCDACGSILEKTPTMFRASIREKGPSADRLDEVGMTILRKKPNGTFSVKGRPLSQNPALKPDLPTDDD